MLFIFRSGCWGAVEKKDCGDDGAAAVAGIARESRKNLDGVKRGGGGEGRAPATAAAAAAAR